MTPATPATVRPQQPYAWGWVFFFALCLAGGIYALFMRPQIPLFSPNTIPAEFETSKNFYVIRMPAVPMDEDLFISKAESWLLSLAAKGYHPMRLSDVSQRFKAGKGVPQKALILLFDPGYRQTFNAMAPLLAKYKFPAVWVTDNEAMNRHDRKFISQHVATAMKKSGLWDVAHYEGKALVVESNGPTIRIGEKSGTWREGAGRRAFNQGFPSGALNRLYVNWNWTDQQMVDRLDAEQSIPGGGYLSLKKIAGHNWGIMMPESKSTDPHFSLKSPFDGRTANISWLGTRGIKNAQFNLDVQMLSGELWLLMRSDDETGESVDVCFVYGGILIGEHRNGQFHQLVSVPHAGLSRPASFSATIQLREQTIRVWINGQETATVATLTPSNSQEGIVRMTVYDKILGGAHAESIRLKMTPALTEIARVLS